VIEDVSLSISFGLSGRKKVMRHEGDKMMTQFSLLRVDYPFNAGSPGCINLSHSKTYNRQQY